MLRFTPLPALDHRVNQPPGGLNRIAAGKQRGIAFQGFQQQALIGFGQCCR